MDIPFCKAVAGDQLFAILTADGKVITWGSNKFGQLGIDKHEASYLLEPDLSRPVIFKDPAYPDKQVKIIDIAACSSSMIALSDDNQVFVWGRKRGLYNLIDSMTLKSVEAKGYEYCLENNMAKPRLMKNNLAYLRFTKVLAKFNTMCLLT